MVGYKWVMFQKLRGHPDLTQFNSLINLTPFLKKIGWKMRPSRPKEMNFRGVRNLRPSARIHLDSLGEFSQESMDSRHITKGPFILRCNCTVLPHCTALHRNCNVTALRCRIKVKFILTQNAVMLQWLAAESNQYIGTATRLQCSMNRPLVWKTENFLWIHLDSCNKLREWILT